MKLELNLSVARSLRQRYLLHWAVPVGLLALLLLVRLVILLPGDWAERRTARAETMREQQQDELLRQRAARMQQTLEGPDYRESLRRVRFVNSLIVEKELSLSDLTAKVTGLLPPQVRLTALELPDASSQEPLVRVAIEAASEEQMEDFLTHIEDSPDFTDVAIMNQGFDQKGANAAPVTVSCVARYVTGRARRS